MSKTLTQRLTKNAGQASGLDAPSRAAVEVLDRISFSLMAGEIGCVVGASGCGKSTLLKLIAGVWPIDTGKGVGSGGKITLYPPGPDARVWLPQRTALIPSLSVQRNVAIAARVRTPDRGEQRARVGWALDCVELSGAARLHPRELSGGMQQRVALARALATRARIMLLDEPFSALDLRLRRVVADRIRADVRERSAAALLTTHTIEESVEVATRVYILSGRPATISAVVRLRTEPADAVFPGPEHVCAHRAEMLATIYERLNSLSFEASLS